MQLVQKKYSLEELHSVNPVSGWKWSIANNKEVEFRIKLKNNHVKCVGMFNLQIQALNSNKFVDFYGGIKDHREWLKALEANREDGINLEITMKWNLDTPESKKFKECQFVVKNLKSFTVEAKKVVGEFYKQNFEKLGSIAVCNIYIYLIMIYNFYANSQHIFLPYFIRRLFIKNIYKYI